jgi:hypothetical protein
MLSPTISDELSNSSGPQIDRQADDTGVTFTTTDACNLARYLATNTITDRQLKWQGFEELVGFLLLHPSFKGLHSLL